MTITEMRNKRAKLWNTMEGFLDTHRNDMGVLSAEDDATYSKMEHDLDSLTNEIKRMETTSILETNTKNIANFTQFDHKQHKRRRAYIKQI